MRGRAKAFTHEQFLARVKERLRSVEVTGQYKRSVDRIEVRCCKCGHKWNPIASSLMSGYGCDKCARRMAALNRRMTAQEFAKRADKLLPNIEIAGEYTLSSQRIDLRCRKCGYEWSAIADSVLRGTTGCSKCSFGVRSHDQVIKQLYAVNPDLKVVGQYKGVHHPLAVECLKCGRKYKGQIGNLLRSTGHGCRICALMLSAEKVARKLQESGQEILGRYNGTDRRCTMRCQKCGYTRDIIPNNAMRGCGCPNCATIGFQLNKPAIFYYVRINSHWLYKVGVTNYTVEERYSKRDYNNITTIYTRYFPLGKDAQDLERKVLGFFEEYRYFGPPVLGTVKIDEIFVCDILSLDLGDNVQPELFENRMKEINDILLPKCCSKTR